MLEATETYRKDIIELTHNVVVVTVCGGGPEVIPSVVEKFVSNSQVHPLPTHRLGFVVSPPVRRGVATMDWWCVVKLATGSDGSWGSIV